MLKTIYHDTDWDTYRTVDMLKKQFEEDKKDYEIESGEAYYWGSFEEKLAHDLDVGFLEIVEMDMDDFDGIIDHREISGSVHGKYIGKDWIESDYEYERDIVGEDIWGSVEAYFLDYYKKCERVKLDGCMDRVFSRYVFTETDEILSAWDLYLGWMDDEYSDDLPFGRWLYYTDSLYGIRRES